MADQGPVARSPIAPAAPEATQAGWVASGRRTSASLTITDCTPITKLLLRASWDGPMSRELGVPFGRASRQDVGAGDASMLLVGSGPGEWLVLAPPGTREETLAGVSAAAAATDELVSIIDLTHGRALMRLTGARSRDLLAKECDVDLTDAMCPDGAALRSSVAAVATDLIRDDRPRVDAEVTLSYLLHCERSSGQYLFDCLLDAGAEFGLDVDGFIPPGI